MKPAVRKLLLQLLLLTAVLHDGQCQGQQFRMLYKSGTINGDFFEDKMDSVIQCAWNCSNTFECTFFGYDATLRNCHVFTDPLYSARQTPLSPDFNLYFLDIYPGSSFVLLDTVMDWVTGKLECEKLGGTLTVPRNRNQAVIMSNYFVKIETHVGISRKDSLSPYLDLNGTEIELFLHPAVLDVYDCVYTYNKDLYTVPCTVHTRPVICQVPF